ncbi:MAG TPA: multiheme c-type cytochrome [Burkholderiaceae bacterium]|nr:multiheme c-type cytochrome [Burkholderiaceae bacterium]
MKQPRTWSRFAGVFAPAIWLAFSLALARPAVAADDALADADQACLGCHGSAELQKTLADGTPLSLHIAGEAFAKSVHAPLGCATCHADITLDTHPAQTREIKDARAYSVAMTESCRGCHEDSVKAAEGSVHAAARASGNAWSPVCTDCHTAHAVTRKAAYETCVACHAPALEAHAKWLPNAPLHFEAVSCAACHAAGAQRMVELRLFDAKTGKPMTEVPAGYGSFEAFARGFDTNGDGLDAAELRDLMARLTGDQRFSKTLRGRIELHADVEAHRLGAPARAIKECAGCHRAGSEPFRKVAIAMLGADGKPLRYDAKTEVLGSVQLIEALREFYAVGATRNLVLDGLLVLALMGGLAVPVGHQTLKWIVRRRSAQEALTKANEDDARRPDDSADNRPR